MAYIYDLSDTWNAAGTTFFGIKMNVTNSASASGSKLLSLQVASTEYFGVDKDGNVTIGNGGDLNISSATGGDASKIYNDAEDLYFATNGSNRMLINSSGNIGIGNVSPGAKLDVTGNIRLSASSPNIELNNGGPMVYSTASNTLMFATGGGPSSPVERMRINSSGNVGIGTSSPGSLLEVNGNTAIRGTAYFGSSLHGNVASDSNTLYLRGTNIAFQNSAGSGTYAYINSSGNFGIGTGSPKTRLQASAATTKNAPTLGSATDAPFYLSNSDTAYGLVIGNSSADGRVWFQAQRTDSSATAYNITLNEAGGNVGIGVSTPSGKLDVRGATGTTAIINSYNDSTTGNVYSYFSNLQNTGNSTSSYHYAGVTQGVNIWYLYGNGTSSWSSDQRLKKNIESTRDGYLDDLCQLRVVKYNWHTDADDKPRELGLIAQEVEAVFPGLVEEALQDIDDTGIRYKVLKGSVLPYMLLKALQEANAKIEALTARVAQLEGN